MASHENPVTLEDCSVATEGSSVAPKFWFDLQSYAHFSWFEDSRFKDILFKGDTKTSSSVWNLLYRNICAELGIASNYICEDSSADAYWYDFAKNIAKTPFLPLVFVGVCMRVDKDLSLIAFEKIANVHVNQDNKKNERVVDRYPTQENLELSLPQKKEAFNAKNRFALEQRFIKLLMADDILTGLCLLYLFLSKENLSLWTRLRLAYDKKTIAHIEVSAKEHVLTPASYRCLKRLWRLTSDTVFIS